MEEMQANAIKVEANILAKKAKLKFESRVTIKEEPLLLLLTIRLIAY